MPTRSRRPKAPRPKPREPLFEPDEVDEVGVDKETSAASPASPASGAVTLRNVVKYELLEQMTPDLLRKFLLHFRSEVEAVGVQLDDFSPDQAWLTRLHEVLQRVDLDPHLQQALIDISEMASPEGLDHALRVAHRFQLELFDPRIHRSMVDTAVRLFLEDGAVFRSSQTSLQATQAEKFAVYCARNDTPLSNYSIGALPMRKLQLWLSKDFGARNRTDFCEISVTENDEEIGFVIVHGRPPRTYGIIDNEKRRSRASHVRETHDIVLFHKETCRLSVQARLAYEQDLYRRLFGRAFFGSSGHFSVKSVVSCNPLLTMGARALSVAGFELIRLVKLRELQVVEGNGRGTRWTLEHADLSSSLEDADLLRLLRRGNIRSVRLDVLLHGQRRAVPVRIIPPNNTFYDRRVGPDQIREFLLERGFLSLNPLPVAPPAAGVH